MRYAETPIETRSVSGAGRRPTESLPAGVNSIPGGTKAASLSAERRRCFGGRIVAKTDAMLEAFTRLNSSVERTGVFSALEKRSLFRLVALNNTLFTDVIAKIGILERSNTAWKYLQYADVWEGLQDEFEIRDRFWKIEFKLNLIQQNSKFFLEVLATDKSNTLEWIIIALISIEIVVMGVEIARGI